ncbi:MAG: restriction endonuclease subunit S [Bacteroidetes bacterium]|nr:restriction endonuclease subunit S [Bacteroidota bacterium]
MKGWETKMLAEVCAVEYGTRVVEKRDGGSVFPVYGGGGATFHMDTFNREDKMVVARFAMSEQCTRFVNGKFFLNDSGLTISPKDDKKILQSFLDYQMLSLNDFIYSLGRGTAQKNLDVPAFREIKISFPNNFSEQQQIVSILDETFSGIEQAKENVQRNLQNAKELFQSEKNQVFENLGKTVGKVPIATVCNEIFAGGDAPKENFSDEKTEKYSIPIFANAVGRKGLYGFTDVSRVTEPSITIAGRGSGTGYTEIRHEPFFPIVRLIVLTPNIEKITLEFLKYAIQSLTILKSGSAIPQLTIPMIKGYSLPLPSLSEQKKIVNQLDTLATETKNLENIYQQKLNALEELKKSILQKAFSGELTENKKAMALK